MPPRNTAREFMDQQETAREVSLLLQLDITICNFYLQILERFTFNIRI